jgi:hypothetical protein
MARSFTTQRRFRLISVGTVSVEWQQAAQQRAEYSERNSFDYRNGSKKGAAGTAAPLLLTDAFLVHLRREIGT